MFKKLKNTLIPNKKEKTNEKESKTTVVLQKSPRMADKKQNYETLVVSEETVELFEHRMTHWDNDVIVSDVRKLMVRPSDGFANQKVVVTEKITIPEQSLMVPIKVNKQIDGKSLEGSIVTIPIKIEQLDVPVIQTLEIIDVPIRTSKRTTQISGPTNGSDTKIEANN